MSHKRKRNNAENELSLQLQPTDSVYTIIDLTFCIPAPSIGQV